MDFLAYPVVVWKNYGSAQNVLTVNTSRSGIVVFGDEKQNFLTFIFNLLFLTLCFYHKHGSL